MLHASEVTVTKTLSSMSKTKAVMTPLKPPKSDNTHQNVQYPLGTIRGTLLDECDCGFVIQLRPDSSIAKTVQKLKWVQEGAVRHSATICPVSIDFPSASQISTALAPSPPVTMLGA